MLDSLLSFHFETLGEKLEELRIGDDMGMTALHYAAGRDDAGSLECAAALLDDERVLTKRRYPSTQGKTGEYWCPAVPEICPLLRVCSSKHDARLKATTEATAKQHRCATQGITYVMEFCSGRASWDDGAMINAVESQNLATPLHLAAAISHKEMVSTCCAQGSLFAVEFASR